jgi:hypothetical protein
MNKFGGNTQPRKFGQGGTLPKGWQCVCGFFNNGRVRYMKAGRELCQQCNQDREYVEDHDA